MWSVGGSEVSVPRRRPPAGPPGHREGTAEALSSQGAMVAGFWGWTGPPKGKGAVEQGPARARPSQCSWGEQGQQGKRPLSHRHPRMSSSRGPTGLQWGSPGRLGLVHLLHGPARPAPPSGSEENIHSGSPGPGRPGGSRHGWEDSGMMLWGQEWGWSAWRRHR